MMARIAPNGGTVTAARGTNAAQIGEDRGASLGKNQEDRNGPTLRAGTMEGRRAIVIGPIGRPALTCGVASIAKIDNNIVISRLSARCRPSR